jgi:hypothetical protein
MLSDVSINRAPVMTLWAAVVAHRLGFTWDEALSLGKAVAGLNAQAKGRRLGIFKPHEEKTKAARDKERGEGFWIELCGRPVPAQNTDEGIRAVKRSGFGGFSASIKTRSEPWSSTASRARAAVRPWQPRSVGRSATTTREFSRNTCRTGTSTRCY